MKEFLLLLLLLPAMASAQCFTNKDKFTGKETKTGMVSLIPGIAINPQMPMFCFAKQDQLLMISFLMQANLTADSFDKEKMLCMIKFKDGTIKKFASSDKSVITTTPITGVTLAFYSVITNEDLLFFKNTPIDIIRFSYKGDETYGYDTEVKPSKAKNIMKSVDCVM